MSIFAARRTARASRHLRPAVEGFDPRLLLSSVAVTAAALVDSHATGAVSSQMVDFGGEMAKGVETEVVARKH